MEILIYFYEDTVVACLGLTDSVFLYLDIKIYSMEKISNLYHIIDHLLIFIFIIFKTLD